MKKILISVLAAGVVVMAPAHAATYEELAGLVNVDAFADVDDDWKRIAANRESACGKFGKSGKRRLDVLIRDYRGLADAVAVNNEAQAMGAARNLAASINKNMMYKKCWSSIARRERVPSRLARMIKKI